ncbi:MAG: hypothetical protein R3324_21600, partial [Halobacteriales archaeon]|nr:hypothetical protein [Halobacteriales archaeon]
MIDISRDGSHVAYIADDPVGRRLYLKEMAEPARPVDGSEGAMSPAFSPDGRAVAYFADDELRSVDVETGASVVVAPAPNAILGAAWTDDDRILFTTGYRSGLLSMELGSGQTVALTTVPRTQSDRLPVVVPGTTRLVYFSFVDPMGIWTVDASTGTQKPVVAGESPQYADGHLFYRRGNTLYGQAFDTQAGAVTGAATPLVTGVSHYAISESGTLVYIPARSTNTRLVLLEASGASRILTSGDTRIFGPAIAPDGRRVAIWFEGTLVLLELRTGAEERITNSIA